MFSDTWARLQRRLGDLGPAEPPDPEAHREKHATGGDHECDVKPCEGKLAVALLGACRLLNLGVRLTAVPTQLLLNAPRGMAITLRRGLRVRRCSGDEQGDAQHCPSGDLLESH